MENIINSMSVEELYEKLQDKSFVNMLTDEEYELAITTYFEKLEQNPLFVI